MLRSLGGNEQEVSLLGDAKFTVDLRDRIQGLMGRTN